MSAPWMPLYVADYLRDTQHLSAAENGAYLLLIMHYWNTGSLPTDERQLQRIARMTAREWANSKATLAAFFEPGWRHKRIESELAKSASKSTARAEAGSRGGMAKSLKTKEAGLAIATILPEQNDAVALASSSQSQSEKKETSSLRSEVARDARRPAKVKGSRLPSDWQPSEADLAMAAGEGFSPFETRRMADGFRDYWLAKAGSDGVKLDWPATWRGWVRRERDRKPTHRQTGPPPDRPLRGSAAIVEALKRMDKPHDPERSPASPAFQLPAS